MIGQTYLPLGVFQEADFVPGVWRIRDDLPSFIAARDRARFQRNLASRREAGAANETDADVFRRLADRFASVAHNLGIVAQRSFATDHHIRLRAQVMLDAYSHTKTEADAATDPDLAAARALLAGAFVKDFGRSQQTRLVGPAAAFTPVVILAAWHSNAAAFDGTLTRSRLAREKRAGARLSEFLSRLPPLDGPFFDLEVPDPTSILSAEQALPRDQLTVDDLRRRAQREAAEPQQYPPDFYQNIRDM